MVIWSSLCEECSAIGCDKPCVNALKEQKESMHNPSASFEACKKADVIIDIDIRPLLHCCPECGATGEPEDHRHKPWCSCLKPRW